MSTISVIWQARYRTVGLESDINFAHDVIIESMKEHVEHIYPRKGIFLDLFVYGVESQKTFTIKHFLQQYTIADIYTFYALGVWYEENHTLIAVGTGIHVVNYITETGLELLGDIETDIKIQIKYNYTPIENNSLLCEGFSGRIMVCNATLFFLLFNTSQPKEIAVNVTSNLTIKKIKLHQEIEIERVEKVPITTQLTIICERKAVGWAYKITPEIPYKINISQMLLFDPITFLEFYKYEIMLITIFLAASHWSSLPAKIRQIREEIKREMENNLSQT